MGREAQLQTKCLNYLKQKRIYCVNVYGSGRTGKGTPDILACVNGQFVAFELKVGSNQMQSDQVIHRKRIWASGGKHYTPRSIEEFKEIINQLGG
ncbi:hypothetical protein MOO45_02770 [Bombilactobacillus folatiphilus]|uniref:VRR-NUC domain-containing protein n=1 Tax=Bombilactobacillus folatiphilus TaxID=2923362 RepID=A0ABY4PA16_9LACO|nr:hypothetical protein [Bombilactobacillus folatiphilus]UQS82588.1 hypothetical protein MOO45_02770 [Bombilactobacillus folatiphilus]